MELGKKIRQLRQKAQYTQEQLGEKLGVGAQAVSKSYPDFFKHFRTLGGSVDVQPAGR